MNCSNCGSDAISVIETRSLDSFVYRRRQCLDCGAMFYTKEYAIEFNDGYEAIQKWHILYRKEHKNK